MSAVRMTPHGDCVYVVAGDTMICQYGSEILAVFSLGILEVSDALSSIRGGATRVEEFKRWVCSERRVSRITRRNETRSSMLRAVAAVVLYNNYLESGSYLRMARASGDARLVDLWERRLESPATVEAQMRTTMERSEGDTCSTCGHAKAKNGPCRHLTCESIVARKPLGPEERQIDRLARVQDALLGIEDSSCDVLLAPEGRKIRAYDVLQIRMVSGKWVDFATLRSTDDAKWAVRAVVAGMNPTGGRGEFRIWRSGDVVVMGPDDTCRDCGGSRSNHGGMAGCARFVPSIPLKCSGKED